jgi:HK97 family phage portal protein
MDYAGHMGAEDQRVSFIGAIDKSMIKAATNYGPLDDRSYYPGGSFYGGYPISSSGLVIGPETAMRLITVNNCVRVRAATMWLLPCHIMERKGKMRNNAEEFYLYDMLLHQPNSWMTAPEFWGMVEAYVCLRGNFYAYKLGLEGRPILEIIPLGDAVQKVTQNEDYSLTYDVRMRNGTVEHYGQDKIFHIRSLTTNGVVGRNPIEDEREKIGIGQAGDRFIGQYFSKGLHPSAIVKHPLSLNSPTHANLKAFLKEKYAGLANAQDFMLLDEGMDITFPEIKLVDAQYLELMKMTEAQICGMFRVPLMLVQAGDKAPTYASSEQFMLAYSIYGVSPDCRNYEEAIRRDLFMGEEKKRYYAKFNVDAILRGDFTTRMEGLQIGVNTEILNPNEARGYLDMNPYEGGNEYRTRTSSMKEDKKDTGKAAGAGSQQ